MSTPARTPHHRHFLSSIDTSVASRALEDYTTTYNGGLDTPLSAQVNRRPSLSYSALSETSSASLPTTPAGYKYVSSHEATPLFLGNSNNNGNPNNSNALRMMNYVKGMPNMVRSHNMATYDLLSTDGGDFSGPAAMSPVCDSFTTSFGSTDSWSTVQDTAVPQLGQPITFRTSSGGVFPKQEYMPDAWAPESFSQAQPVSSMAPTSSFESISGQQYFSPQQLVMPQEVHEQDMIYSQVDSGMTSPIDPHTLNSASFDAYSYGSWSPGDSSPGVNQYSLPGDDFSIRGKEEPGLPVMSHSQSTFSPSRRLRLRQRGPAHKRGRAGSLRLVANHYDVDLAIDSKGIEYNEQAGRYMPKKLNVETKRWKCSVPGCESRSARKEHLRRHELSHQLEKQFHCNLPKCGRAITRSDNLIQHLMTHARPSKAGKRNIHYSREKIERMVLETMLDKKLAERTITNLGKAIEREQDKWQTADPGLDWHHDADENTADCF